MSAQMFAEKTDKTEKTEKTEPDTEGERQKISIKINKSDSAQG